MILINNYSTVISETFYAVISHHSLQPELTVTKSRVFEKNSLRRWVIKKFQGEEKEKEEEFSDRKAYFHSTCYMVFVGHISTGQDKNQMIWRSQ